jgi:putative ABC transport system permease protein
LTTKIHIAFRHLRSRPFQTFSVISIVAFSVGLAVALFVLAQGLRLGLIRAVEPFDLIVGAKGSPYQLVLNTVFLQDVPVGNMTWEDYADLSDDARVDFAVPLGFGDSYRGYPVIGTTAEILNIRVRASDPPWLRIGEGRWFEGANEKSIKYEAVLGLRVAAESGLRVGDSFRTSHGIVAGDEHDNDFSVVGIAEATRGPYDRAVFVPLETIWAEHKNHVDDEGEDHEETGDVTAVLIRPRSYPDAYSLAVSFQGDPDKQLVFPAQTVIRLFSLMGRGEAFLSIVVYAVGGCALLTTLLVLYWAGAARRGERMLLHVLGVPRGTLVFISWLEGTVALLAGVLVGELLGRLGASAAFAALGNATAVDSAVPFTLQEFIAPVVVLATGSLGSLFAAWRGGFILD